MNLLLFEAADLAHPLPRNDPRAIHLLTVLRRGEGGTFDAGVINGPRGQATITRITSEALTFSFAAHTPAAAPEPITLVVGLPRPQSARHILRDATTVGVGAIHFVTTEKGEPGYAGSTLWTSGEWRRHLLSGAEQAFDTRLPEVTVGRSLVAVVTAPTATHRLALDNYEAALPLGRQQLSAGGSVMLAIGSERGWAPTERATLREQGFQFCHLGPRVLRTETACTAALALVRASLGLI